MADHALPKETADVEDEIQTAAVVAYQQPGAAAEHTPSQTQLHNHDSDVPSVNGQNKPQPLSMMSISMYLQTTKENKIH